MGFGSLCLSPDTTLRTALTSTGTPLDDWSWHLAFLVGKGGFRYAPKRLPVWHRLRLDGLARVGQNHLCRFSRVFQSSCLRLTLATRWLRGVVRQCWGTADTLCQSHVVEESFDSPRVCTCRSNCFLSFLSVPPSSMSCPLLQAAPRLDREESNECWISVTSTNWQKKSGLLACSRTSSRCSRSDVQRGPRRCTCCRNALETPRKNFFPPMVSSHSESTKVKLTHPKEIQKSMEVKRRKEAKKQNDFCGGKRHIATFQNYRNQLVLGRPRKAWYRRKASFTSCSARWQRTWHVQRYSWRAKGAKCTQQRIQKLDQRCWGRTIPFETHTKRSGDRRDHPEVWRETFCPRASGRAIEIDRDGDASANFERP